MLNSRTHERKSPSYQLAIRVVVLPETRIAWSGLAPQLRKMPSQAALVNRRTTPGQPPREIGSDQLAHGRLGLGVRLLGAGYPIGVVAVEDEVMNSPARCLKGRGELHLSRPGKLPDVPPRVPGADNEQPLTGQVELPAQLRPFRGLGLAVGAGVHRHPSGMYPVKQQDRRAEGLGIGRLASPSQR